MSLFKDRDISEIVGVFIGGGITILLLIGAVALGLEVVYEFQNRADCRARDIPLAACGSYHKHDVKADINMKEKRE